VLVVHNTILRKSHFYQLGIPRIVVRFPPQNTVGLIFANMYIHVKFVLLKTGLLRQPRDVEGLIISCCLPFLSWACCLSFRKILWFELSSLLENKVAYYYVADLRSLVA